jgi:endonuclease-3
MKADVEAVLRKLKKEFPNPGAMELGDPYRTLVAVILSARTRDEQVLKLLPKFFDAFPSPERLALATTPQVESRIDTIGMYRQKARNIRAMAKKLVEEFGGEVPSTMDELVSLPGVGRKTASVVLVACFGQAAIAVDTHVFRVTNRLGWVKTKTPEKTEAALLELVPTKLQRSVNQVFVKFGRYICIGGTPRCWACPIREHCAYPNKNLIPPKDADEVRADLRRRERALETLREAVVR